MRYLSLAFALFTMFSQPIAAASDRMVVVGSGADHFGWNTPLLKAGNHKEGPILLLAGSRAEVVLEMYMNLDEKITHLVLADIADLAAYPQLVTALSTRLAPAAQIILLNSGEKQGTSTNDFVADPVSFVRALKAESPNVYSIGFVYKSFVERGNFLRALAWLGIPSAGAGYFGGLLVSSWGLAALGLLMGGDAPGAVYIIKAAGAVAALLAGVGIPWHMARDYEIVPFSANVRHVDFIGADMVKDERFSLSPDFFTRAIRLYRDGPRKFADVIFDELPTCERAALQVAS